MPKIQIGAIPQYYKRYVKNKDCDKLVDKISVLEGFLTVLSFHDKQQLLYIARMIERNHMKLPENRYIGYECKLNELLDKYTRQGR